jgi:hypothetical protein
MKQEFLIQGYDEDGSFIDEKLVNSEGPFDALISAICRFRYDALKTVEKSKTASEFDSLRILASVHIVRIDGKPFGIDEALTSSQHRAAP